MGSTLLESKECTSTSTAGQASSGTRRTPTTSEEAFQPNQGMNPVELAGLFALDDAAFRKRFGDTPLWRSKRRGILRNAVAVLANQP